MLFLSLNSCFISSIVRLWRTGLFSIKSGQLVSKKLGRDFIDIDHEIEKDFQMTIPEMFQQKGEAFFRQTEKEYIFQMCEHTMGNIVSLGISWSISIKSRPNFFDTSWPMVVFPTPINPISTIFLSLIAAFISSFYSSLHKGIKYLKYMTIPSVMI